MSSGPDVASALGLRVDSAQFRWIVRVYGLRLDDTDPTRVYWVNEEAGLELVQEGDDTIRTIFFFGGDKDGFKQFAGELPRGLDFRDTRSAVRSALGTPAKAGGPTNLPGVAQDGGWDRYDMPASTLHVSFHPTEDRIFLVTLMLQRNS